MMITPIDPVARTEQRLIQQVAAEWEAWRRNPEGSAPNHELTWEIIRLLRRVKQHGLHGLHPSQYRLLERFAPTILAAA
jgi:hypothetical protein